MFEPLKFDCIYVHDAPVRGRVSISNLLIWYIFFSMSIIISVVSKRLRGDNERFSTMKRCTVISWILPLSEFEPGTSWPEVKSANPSNIRMLPINSWHSLSKTLQLKFNKGQYWCSFPYAPHILTHFFSDFCYLKLKLLIPWNLRWWEFTVLFNP